MTTTPLVDAYLDRLEFEGPVSADEDTLFRLHAAHLAIFPYENLDIQLGQKKRLDEKRFAERLIEERRGGWCYEMNGLLSTVLREIGFRVDRVGGAAARQFIGDGAIGNHMVLVVHLEDRPLIADVGLGDGPLYPFPIEERSWTENGFEFSLAPEDGGWWRFSNHAHGLAPSFDFTLSPRDLRWYAPQCKSLQQNENSPFTQLAMTFRRDERRIRALRELTYLEIDGPDKQERELETFEEYQAVLTPLIEFDLENDMRELFDRVSSRVKRRRAEAKAAAEAAKEGEAGGD